MAEQNGRNKTTTAAAAVAATAVNGVGGGGAPREFVEGWTLAQTLGEGAYGEVKLLINRQSGEAVAMKMVDLKKHPDASASVRKEVCIQKALQHSHILRFFGQRSQGDIEYIFLEYAAGGELFDRIEPDVGMPQQEAQRYFKQLMSGVEYLHMRGIAHRDLKPENLLLDDNDNIKISDFGMATIFRANGKERLLDKRCGTLPYVAPEVLIRSYQATPADIWSCGIILITMLAGELPWDHPTLNCPDYMLWKDNNRYTTATPWKKLDNLVLSMLRKILTPNANARPSVEKIQEHKWCRTQFNDSNRRLSNGNSTVDTVDCCSPRAKRLRSSQDLGPSLDDSTSRMYQSQPVPCMLQCADGDENQRPRDIHVDASRNGWSFSQPAMLDNMILCTQLNPTQGAASQNVFQRLVRRMTRFFVTSKYEEAVKRLTAATDKLGYTSKVNDNGVVTISTMDRRKLQLVFKANPIEMDGKLLLDFRLSKGCGLEFKRSFVKIKQCLADIILKGPVTWPIFVATNTVP